MVIRLRACLTIVVAALILLAKPASAAPTGYLKISAARVDYYSNRFILTADGNVRVRLSDGTVVTGETFSMDLKLNRFLIAGDVHIDGAKVHETGAALAGFPDLDRMYFLPNTPEPDRWTYFGLDYSNRHAGREQPGDAFDFPDLHGARPFIKAKSVVVYPQNNIEFPVGSQISLDGVYTPTPGWVVNFSSNSNFYQNGYSGAVFDIQVPFAGSANAISAMDIRYDQYRGAYLSFEQHIVHNADYLVFTINPLTQDQRQFDLIAYKRVSPALETRLFAQLSTLSTWIWKEPSEASAFTNFSINARAGRYAVGVNADQYNNGLLPTDDSGFTTTGLRVDGHPFDVQLSVQSFEDEFRFFRYLGVPVKFQYRAGYGWNYDGFGIPAVNGEPTWGGALYPLISHTYVGTTVYTSSVKIAKQVTISAKFDGQREWFSLPHHIDTYNTSATVAYTPLTTKLPAAYLSYSVLNIGDYYGKDQLQAYPPGGAGCLGQTPPTTCNTIVNQYGTFTGLDAFRGIATSRSLTGSAIYTPTPYFALNLTMQYFNVTPAPVPGVGGQPPYQFTGDVRFRLTPNLLVDVARAYYFHFGGQNWSNQFTVQLSP